MDHLEYMMKKQEKTLKLFEEQVLNKKVFRKTAFDKLDDLKEEISDIQK